MAGRNGGHNLAGDDFVGEFATAPVADRSLTISRRFTDQCDDVADLFGADGGRFARARRIGEALFKGEFGERDGLAGKPARAPRANGIDLHAEEASDLGVVEASVSSQNNAGTQDELLGGSMAPNEQFKSLAFCISQG